MGKAYTYRILLEGEFEGKPIRLTKEMGMYCVEYFTPEGEDRWWNPCPEDALVVRSLYWRIVRNGKKMSRAKRVDLFFRELAWTMRVWDYDI